MSGSMLARSGPPAPAIAGLAGRGVEIVRFGPDPGQELGQGRVRLQARDVVQASRQLGFRKARVDGAVADLMQLDGGELGAALQLRHQVVAARPRTRRDGSLAERTDGRRWRRGSPASLALHAAGPGGAGGRRDVMAVRWPRPPRRATAATRRTPGPNQAARRRIASAWMGPRGRRPVPGRGRGPRHRRPAGHRRWAGPDPRGSKPCRPRR